MVPVDDLLPDWYFDWIDRDPIDEKILEDFWCLSTCRHYGMTEGPIPWTVIMEYVDREEIEGVARRIFTRIIQVMDAAYLKWRDEERNKK